MHLAESAGPDKIHVELLQAADVESTVQLIASAFSTADPPAVAMGLSAAEFSAFLRMLAPHAVADGLTVVARSSARNEIIGALLTDDFAVPPPLDPQQLSNRFLPILTLLDSLDDQYRGARTIGVGEYLHLFMLAVDAQHGGRGIAQRLVEYCLENGTRKGYRWAVTEATGAISKRVFRKLGFEERFRIPYCNFKYCGEAVFSSITGHDGVALMDKSLV